jgi:hypothetical protein
MNRDTERWRGHARRHTIERLKGRGIMADDLGDTDELSLEELQAQVAKQLPDREALSLVSTDPVVDMPMPEEAPAGEEGGSEPDPGSGKLPERL